MAPAERGPTTWREWRAFDRGGQEEGRIEAALYSDAHVTGHAIDQLGPYKLINALGNPRVSYQPAVVVRASSHGGTAPLDVVAAKTSDVSTYHGGDAIEEIAALVSLALGIRCRSGGITRMWGLGGEPDPLGQPVNFDHDPPYLPTSRRGPRLPRLTRTVDLEHAVPLLRHFSELTPERATAVVRAARLYQQAVWVADSDPNQAWLQLVSALEVAAPSIRDKRTALTRLEDHSPVLGTALREAGDEHAERIAKLIGDTARVQRRVVAFATKHLPPPPEPRPYEWARVDWSAVPDHLRVIYNYRSRALHDGTPFPEPMCEPPGTADYIHEERPHGLATSAKGGLWMAQDLPMLRTTFEYIVRGVLQRWWQLLSEARDGT